MDSYTSRDMINNVWDMSNPNVIDYYHQPPMNKDLQPNSANWQTDDNRSSTQHFSFWQIDEGNKKSTQPKQKISRWHANEVNNPFRQETSFGMWQRGKSTQNSPSKNQSYNPFIGDDMDVSDDERNLEMTNQSSIVRDQKALAFSNSLASNFSTAQLSRKLQIKSGAGFYKGLILYIPDFDQIVHSDKNTSAIKMLFASFEFSFKIPMRIEIKQRPNNHNVTDAVVIFQDQVIVRGSTLTQAVHNEISVKALELLSETCYTIQTKPDYIQKCKLIDAMEMKTLNMKRWETLCQKYPQLVEITKDSHIQKTLSVFLDNHTSTGIYDDIVFCNLSREDVRYIKSVVDFFHLTMLPCCVTSSLAPNQGPCVVSIHKYTSAKKLLEILVECGGENDKFRLYSPDTFKDFYKLHQNYWDSTLKTPNQNKMLLLRTTLDEEVQSAILKPYENIISELFQKHKILPINKEQKEDLRIRQAGDAFMKDTFKINISDSKKLAPVDRMQLLLKYMEQLQDYGSRVMSSGHTEMIKIYHSAIDNLRKDLEACRKDLEKEQKGKTSEEKESKSYRSSGSRSSFTKRTSPKTSRPSPISRRYNDSSRKRSYSPRGPRSSSPKHYEKRRSVSPERRQRLDSPRRSRRSNSPRLRSTQRTRYSPSRRHRSPSPLRRHMSPSLSRRNRSPFNKSSPRRSTRSPRHQSPIASDVLNNDIYEPIFIHKLKRFVALLKKNRIEIQDTPSERRGDSLLGNVFNFQEQVQKLYKEALANREELGTYLNEIDICQEEIAEQIKLISGNVASGAIKRNPTLTSWIDAPSEYSSYPVIEPPPPPPSIMPYMPPFN